jgi:hypothetical protein
MSQAADVKWPPDELYALEAEDDLINDGLYERNAIFVTKDGATATLNFISGAPYRRPVSRARRKSKQGID